MKRHFLSILALIISLVAVVFTFYTNTKVERVVVVDVIRVFDEFKLKKDLEKRVEAPLSALSGQIDSLKALFEQAQQRNDEKAVQGYGQDLYQLQQQAQNAYELSNKNINEQVWKRLNPLIDEFGKVNNYKVIIGANGMGSVLYNDKAIDRTDALIKYVNSKYEKGN
jgi:outer membrane protein